MVDAVQLTNALERAVFGKPTSDGQPSKDVALVAYSDNLTPETARAWRGYAAVEPLAHPAALESQAIGIFAVPDGNFLWARAHNQLDNQNLPAYEYILLPRDILQQMAGSLSPLLALAETPIPVYEESTHIAPLDVPPPPTWTGDRRAALFRQILAYLPHERVALSLLGAALSERGLLIRGFDGDYWARAEVVQSLMMLLPAPARCELTFSTHVTEHDPTNARIVFGENLKDSGRWLADFDAGEFPGDEVLQSPYVQHLARLWLDDVGAFIAALKPLELTAPYLMANSSLEEGLVRVVERYELDKQVLAGETVPSDTLKYVLTGEVPLNGELQLQYAESLLLRALHERDTQAAAIVARYMDEHPEVDAALNEILNESLTSQPDSVYAFIRARLAEGIDEHWLPRLKAATVSSLQVALHEGDSDTLWNWLKLIAREPAAYQLTDVLHEGILAAQQRAHIDGVLGCQLIALAVKRDIKAIDLLLEDDEFMAQLPDEPLGLALREYDAQAIAELPAQGRELFLVALARAARARIGEVFTPAVIQNLWEIYANGYTVNLPPHYQPDSIIGEWVERGVDWLAQPSLETLLTLILASNRDDLFYHLTHHLSNHEVLFPMLATVLQNSGRSVTDILGLIGQVVTAGDMTQQQAVNTYIALLAAWEWRRDALPLVEQLARIMQQSNNLVITSEVCWHLMDIAAETKNELVARIAAKRLLDHLQTQPEPELVDQLLRMFNLTQWSSLIRQKLMDWMRQFARTQPLINLQQLDKAMEGKKPLEDARNIVQTSIALKKMLGKRTLDDLAGEISTTYTILQALVDSFDPSPKQPLEFDQETVRGELAVRQDELTPEKRKLLAKNLKELALLITEMADNRSKTPLMRREDEFERQIMTGEQQPQSAIDTLKWLSGYLDGAQAMPEEE
jgi:hypothetical protein